MTDFPSRSYGARLYGILHQMIANKQAMERLNKKEPTRHRQLSLAITETENAIFRLEAVLNEIPFHELARPEE